MRKLEEGQWQCPYCRWFSQEPPNSKQRPHSEWVHKNILCKEYKKNHPPTQDIISE